MPLVRRQTDTPTQAAPSVPDLLSSLGDSAAEVRFAAARDLAQAPGGVEALGAALGREVDERVREAILTSLTRAGAAEAVRALSPHLRSDDAALRRGTLDALRAMGRATRPFLAELLNDADPDVRLLACEIVRELPSVEATPLLCELLEREHEVNVCASAIEVIAEVGSAAALPALACCASRFGDSPFLTFAIGVARKRLAASDPHA